MFIRPCGPSVAQPNRAYYELSSILDTQALVRVTDRINAIFWGI